MKERLYPAEMVREVLQAELGVELHVEKPKPEAEVTFTIEEMLAVADAINKGRPLGSLLMTHVIPLHRIEAIAAQYNRLNGSLVLPPEMVRRLAELPLPCTLPFPDADELEYTLRELLKRGRCGCGGDASLCNGCARRRFEPRPDSGAA